MKVFGLFNRTKKSSVRRPLKAKVSTRASSRSGDTYVPGSLTLETKSNPKKLGRWAATGAAIGLGAALLFGAGALGAVVLTGMGATVGLGLCDDNFLSMKYDESSYEKLFDPSNPNNPIFWDS